MEDEEEEEEISAVLPVRNVPYSIVHIEICIMRYKLLLRVFIGCNVKSQF